MDIFGKVDLEQTRILPSNSVNFGDNDARISFKKGDKTIVFEQDRTTFVDMANMDKSGFIGIGRSDENKIVLNKSILIIHNGLTLI